MRLEIFWSNAEYPSPLGDLWQNEWVAHLATSSSEARVGEKGGDSRE